MVVQNNIPALNSHRNLQINNSSLSRNLERLSSGFRINRAADDAAGLSISERMRGQIRGLAMAEQNTSQGINLIQTAEGGLQETQNILQRIRELSVMSANATFGDTDRQQIHHEVVALIDEIDRIASSTHYNGISLIDGSFGSVRVNDTTNEFVMTNVLGLNLNNLELSDFGEEIFEGVTDLNVRITVTEMTGMNPTAAGDFREQVVSLQVGDRTFTGFIEGHATSGIAGTSHVVFRDINGEAVASTTLEGGNTNALTSGVISNVVLQTGTAANPNDPPAFHVVNARVADHNRVSSALVFQIGANGGQDQRAALTVRNMNAGALGFVDVHGQAWTVRQISASHIWNSTLDGGVPIGAEGVTEQNPGISILTNTGANAAIDVLDAALDQVSSQRAQLGAMQNRLESTFNSLGIARENLTAAESTIRDVDMAQEMMMFTQNNILSQAAQAMLAQANQLPQGILQLLR